MNNKEENRFKIVYKEKNAFNVITMIFVDKETGVNYMFVNSGYGGGLTPLLDDDGKPVVTR